MWWDLGEWLVTDEIENEIAYDVTHAHGQDLLAQLRGGIRFFDLRVTSRNDVFYVYHGLLGRPLTEVLDDIRTFMAQPGHEHEFIVVGVSHLATGTNSDNAEKFTPALHHALMQLLVDNNRLGPYLYPRDGRSTGDLLSTPLGNIVDDGPKVLVMYSDDDFYKYDKQAQKWLPGPVAGDTNAGQFWYESYTSGSYTNTVEMHDELPCPRDNPANERGQFDDQLCNARQHAAGGSLKGFTLFQTLTANNDVALRSFCWHAPWSPACLVIDRDAGPSTLHGLSRIVNAHLLSMVSAMSPQRPGLVLVDFYEESAVVSEAIRLNQRDTRAPTSQATRYPPANRYGGSFGDVTVTLTAADEAGGSGVRGILVTTEGAQQSSGDYCGARKEVVIKAKGLTTIKYRPSDREGNLPQWQSLAVRTDQKCDFNRDGKTDAADRAGLLNSVRDTSIMFLGDLDEDGRYTSQEWIRCWYHLYYGRPL